MKKLYKSETDRKIFGVCGGIAECYDLDPSLVRIITTVLVCCAGVGIIPYIIAAIIMPNKTDIQ